MTNKDKLTSFIIRNNYDIRKNHNARWIDQKCTPDVVSTIADCICSCYSESENNFFSSSDIRQSEYADKNISTFFKKPSVNNKNAIHEYDKFFQQPMEMLANAGILIKEKRGNRNYYRINRWDLLEYIATRERNALDFICIYVKKVLEDSGLMSRFDTFFSNQDKQSYRELKNEFTCFTISNTPINTPVECGRIFTKIINPLAYERNAKGTKRGHISKDIITFDMLMYNSLNFRDIYADKPKGITRKEYIKTHPIDTKNIAYYHYQSSKAKKYLRIFNTNYRRSKSECLGDTYEDDEATHMHHIFPESDYPEICFYYENIIALTPTQHLNYAHPNGNTQFVDSEYQHTLLLAKVDRIKENLTGDCEEKIYSFDNLKHVLVIGFEDSNIEEIEPDDYISIMNVINAHYA